MIWDLDQLEALAATLTEGSFDRAAQRLRVTPSAVSQRIKALETSAGSVLVIRSRPVRATPAGQTLLRVARQIEAVVDEAARDLDATGAGPTPAVALAVNADSLATWLLPALAAVDPPVQFDLRRADETRTAELLRDGTVIAAVTASATPVGGCVVRPLGQMRYRPRASARFVEQWLAAGPTPRTLSAAPVVVFDRTDTLQDRYLARYLNDGASPPRHYVPGSSAFVEAVALGLGWGMVPDLQADHPAALVAFDPAGTVDIPLYWQQWRLASRALDRVAATVRAHAERALGAE